MEIPDWPCPPSTAPMGAPFKMAKQMVRTMAKVLDRPRINLAWNPEIRVWGLFGRGRWCSWWNSTWKLSLDMIWSFGRSCSSSKLPCWSIMFLYPEPAAGIAELQDGGDGIQEVESQPRPPGPRQKYVTGFGSIYFPFFAWQLETTTLYHSEVPEIIKQVFAKKLALLCVVRKRMKKIEKGVYQHLMVNQNHNVNGICWPLLPSGNLT